MDMPAARCLIQWPADADGRLPARERYEHGLFSVADDYHLQKSGEQIQRGPKELLDEWTIGLDIRNTVPSNY